MEERRDEAAFEVIVIDNNSEDGSPDMVEESFPWVRLFRMKENLGFTGGHNFAMEQRKSANVFLLNSDTIVHPGALRTLLDHLKANPDIGILGPKLLNSDGSLQFSCRRFPNPLAALFRNTFIGRLFPNNRFTRDYLMGDFTHDQPKEVDWLSGAAMLASEKLLKEVGPMDPNYFMFCEDVDWCFRSWQKNLKVVYLPQSVITHAIGRSTDKAPNRMIGRFHSSMFRFYRKNMLPRVFILWRPFAYAAAGLAILTRASIFIVKNKFDDRKRRAEAK